MANFTIAYDNQADSATLTGGSWNASFPLNNLKDYVVSKKARTTNAVDGSAVVKASLAANYYLECAGLMAHNLSTSATYRVRVFSDSGFTVQTYDSGTLSLYPTGSLPEVAIPSGSSNSGTAKPTATDTARFQKNLYHFLSPALQARYIQIEVFDSTNAAGYLEFGRLFLGRAFTSMRNPAYGRAASRLTSRTDVVEAEDGTPYFNTRRARMSIPFALEWLTEDEAMRVLDMQALLDVHGEALVVWNHADVAYWFRRQVFGRLNALDPIEHPLYATYATAFQVEGVLYE